MAYSRLLAFILFFSGLAITAHCQVLRSVSDLKLDYWRSFDGVISQVVRADPEGRYWLSTTVGKGMDAKEREKNSVHTVQQVSQSDLEPVLALFNSYDARVYFAETKPKLMADGSSLSITLNQNRFAMTFWSQNPFEKNAPPFTAELTKAARLLFKLAKLDLKNESLY